jgi:hypothetical protein
MEAHVPLLLSSAANAADELGAAQTLLQEQSDFVITAVGECLLPCNVCSTACQPKACEHVQC